MNGTRVLEILHKEFPEIIKIMITGYPSLENAVASLKRGADAYLMKPVNPLNLLKVIDEKLKRRLKKKLRHKHGDVSSFPVKMPVRCDDLEE